jgi:hypothetical protein
MNATFSDFSERPAAILEALARNESVTLTHDGEVKGILKPAAKNADAFEEFPAVGMWADMEGDATELVSEWRK